MSTKAFTVPEVFAEIAKTIKTQIADYEAGLVSMRQKELSRSHGKLAKSELCLLCAGPEFSCGCALQKSEELNKDQMSASYAKDVGITGPHTKAKASYGDGPQGPVGPRGPVGQMNPRIKDNTPKIKGKLDKSAMASSSASAINPPKSRPPTPVAVANHEMGSFKSIATKPPISSMGRSKASVSGSIMAKDEMGGDDSGSSMMMSETEPEHTVMCQDDNCKNKGKLHKPASNAAYETGLSIEHVSKQDGKKYSSVVNKRLDKMELKTTPKESGNQTGSGGETKKISLKKSAIPGNKAPEVQGVAGKQPVGQDGGGVNKATPQLADAAGMKPAAKWGQEGLPQLKTQLAAVKGGVSWLKSTHASAHRTPVAQAAPKSQRFHGALPLQRSEKEPDKKMLFKMEDLGKCAMCKSEEHPGKCMKALEA